MGLLSSSFSLFTHSLTLPTHYPCTNETLSHL